MPTNLTTTDRDVPDMCCLHIELGADQVGILELSSSLCEHVLAKVSDIELLAGKKIGLCQECLDRFGVKP